MELPRESLNRTWAVLDLLPASAAGMVRRLKTAPDTKVRRWTFRRSVYSAELWLSESPSVELFVTADGSDVFIGWFEFNLQALLSAQLVEFVFPDLRTGAVRLKLIREENGVISIQPKRTGPKLSIARIQQ